MVFSDLVFFDRFMQGGISSVENPNRQTIAETG